METLLSSVPALAGAIEKGGIIAVLLIVIVAGGMDWWRLRKDNKSAYVNLGKAREAVVMFKTLCDLNKIPYDLAGLKELFPEEKTT